MNGGRPSAVAVAAKVREWAAYRMQAPVRSTSTRGRPGQAAALGKGRAAAEG